MNKEDIKKKIDELFDTNKFANASGIDFNNIPKFDTYDSSNTWLLLLIIMTLFMDKSYKEEKQSIVNVYIGSDDEYV